MNEIFKHSKLNDFVTYASNNGIDFAKILYICHANKFINTKIHWIDDKEHKTHTYNEYYLEDPKYKYFVWSILNTAYLMYEVADDERILIWLCYTEEHARNKGYITILLTKLVEQFSNNEIVAHTYNKSIIKICKSLNITLRG